MINVKNKKCICKDCKKIPSFNIENENKPLYCFEHKLDNMVKLCLEENKLGNDAIQYITNNFKDL